MPDSINRTPDRPVRVGGGIASGISAGRAELVRLEQEYATTQREADLIEVIAQLIKVGWETCRERDRLRVQLQQARATLDDVAGALSGSLGAVRILRGSIGETLKEEDE